MAESKAYNQDCLEYMRSLPDNYFDLCIADPPYGDAMDGEREIDHLHSSARSAERKRRETQTWNRFGERFDRYKHEIAPYTHTHKRGTRCQNRRNMG